MITLRKASLVLTFAASLLAGPSVRAQSEPFPTKPIKLIVTFEPGGTGDFVARILAERMGADLGQSVLIENRSGGGGAIGAQAAARSKADGYTILQIATTHLILPNLQKNVPYDLERDFTPVFGANVVPQVVVVNAKSSFRSLADLVAAAKANPGALNFGSGGNGSLSHLTGALLVTDLKISTTHVPFRGLGPAVQALLGNNVHFVVGNIPDVIKFVNSGDFRLLVITSEQRLSFLPDVPTMTEQGVPSLSAAFSWNSYLVPAGTPGEIVDRLYRAFAKAASDPGVKERLDNVSVAIKPMNGAELRKYLQAESARWRRAIEANQIKIEN